MASSAVSGNGSFHVLIAALDLEWVSGEFKNCLISIQTIRPERLHHFCSKALCSNGIFILTP